MSALDLALGSLTTYLELEDNFTASMSKAMTKVYEASDSFEKIGRNVTRLGVDLLPISAAITSFGAATWTASKDFEQVSTRWVSLAGVTKDELEGVRKKVLELAPATGVGPQALAEGMYTVSSTMGDTKIAMEVLEVAAKGTMIGLGDTNSVARALTATLNSYGPANISAAHAADVLLETIRLGGAEAKELAPRLADVVPMASMLGVSFEEVGANIATFTKLGAPAADAVVTLSGVLTAMQKPTAKQRQALASLGLTLSDLRDSIKNNGLAATLTSLTKKFGENHEGLAAVFGRIQALRNVIGTTGQEETYLKVLDDLSKAEGRFAESAEIAATTQAFTWDQLKARIQVAAIEIGNHLSTTFRDVMKDIDPLVTKVEGLIKKFGELDQSTKSWIVGIAVSIAVLSPVLIIIGQTISAVGAIGTAFMTVGKLILGGFALVSGVISDVVVTILAGVACGDSFLAILLAIMSPVGWLIAGFAALGAAVWYFWEPIKKVTLAIAAKVWPVFQGWIEGLSTAFSKVWRYADFFFTVVSSVAQILGNAVWNFFAGVIGKIGDIFSSNWQAISKWWESLNVVETVTNKFKELYNAVSSWIGRFVDSLGIVEKAKAVWGALKDLLDGAYNIFLTLIGVGKKVGEALLLIPGVATAWEVLNKTIGWVKDKLSSLWDKVLEMNSWQGPNPKVAPALISVGEAAKPVDAELTKLQLSVVGTNEALGVIGGSGLPGAKDALAEYQGEVGAATDAQKKLNKELESLREEIVGKNLAEEYSKLSLVYGGLDSTMQKSPVIIGRVVDKLEELGVEVEKLPSNLKALYLQQQENISALKETQSRMNAFSTRTLLDQVRVGDQAFLLFQKDAKLTPIEGVKAIGMLSEEWDRYNQKWVSTAYATEGLWKGLPATIGVEIKDLFGNTVGLVGETLAQYRSDIEEAEEKTLSFSKGIKQLHTAIDKLSDSAGPLGGLMKITGSIIGNLDVATEAGKQFKEGQQQIGINTEKTITGLARMASGLITAVGALDQATNYSNKTANALSGAATGMAAGAQIAGPWGAAVGGVIGGLTGLFKAGSNAKKALEAARTEAKKTVTSLQESVGSTELFNTVMSRFGTNLETIYNQISTSTAYGSKVITASLTDQIARWTTATEAMEKYGLTLLDLGEDFQKLSLSETTTGLLDDWTSLMQFGADPSKVIVKMSNSLVDLAKSAMLAGEQVPVAIENLFLQFSQSDDAITSSKDSLNDFLQSALTSGTQIPVAMQPVLEKFIRMGLVTEDVARQMLGLKEDTMPSLSDITEAAGRYGLKLDELGPKVKALQITEASNQIVADWNTLTAAGADVNVILGLMKDKTGEYTLTAGGMGEKVADLVKQALKYGTELPAGMQPIVQAMLDAGMLTDENGKKLSDLSKLTFAKDLTQMFDQLISKLDELIKAFVGTGGLEDQVQGMDLEVPAPWSDWPDPPQMPNYKDPYGFSQGGTVPQRWAGGGSSLPSFNPIGTDTVPAMLTPGERVLSIMENRDLANQQNSTNQSIKDLRTDTQAVKASIDNMPRQMQRIFKDMLSLNARRRG